VRSRGWKAREALDAAQAMLLGKLVRDPTALWDMWSGPGREVYPAEAEEGTNWEAGRSWKNCGPQWDNAESDGFCKIYKVMREDVVGTSAFTEGMKI